MAVSVVMPALEMAQESGKVISWRKREGEKVAKGEPLLEVETDKAVVGGGVTGRRHPLRSIGARRCRNSRGTDDCVAARSRRGGARGHGADADRPANR